jgi:hypothetical protein
VVVDQANISEASHSQGNVKFPTPRPLDGAEPIGGLPSGMRHQEPLCRRREPGIGTAKTKGEMEQRIGERTGAHSQRESPNDTVRTDPNAAQESQIMYHVCPQATWYQPLIPDNWEHSCTST